MQVGTLITALSDYLKMKDNEIQDSDTEVPYIANCLDRWLWPVYSATLKSDLDLKDYPDWYRKYYIAFQKKGTGAVTGEKFPTIGSIFMLIISLLYVFFILG